jgi:hypothetical protein
VLFTETPDVIAARVEVSRDMSWRTGEGLQKARTRR